MNLLLSWLLFHLLVLPLRHKTKHNSYDYKAINPHRFVLLLVNKKTKKQNKFPHFSFQVLLRTNLLNVFAFVTETAE